MQALSTTDRANRQEKEYNKDKMMLKPIGTTNQ